jgi:hypothetical protein
MTQYTFTLVIAGTSGVAVQPPLFARSGHSKQRPYYFLFTEHSVSVLASEWLNPPHHLSAIDGGVIDIHAAFGQHLQQFTIANTLFVVPAYCPENDVLLKMPAFKHVHESRGDG